MVCYHLSKLLHVLESTQWGAKGLQIGKSLVLSFRTFTSKAVIFLTICALIPGHGLIDPCLYLVLPILLQEFKSSFLTVMISDAGLQLWFLVEDLLCRNPCCFVLSGLRPPCNWTVSCWGFSLFLPCFVCWRLILWWLSWLDLSLWLTWWQTYSSFSCA